MENKIISNAAERFQDFLLENKLVTGGKDIWIGTVKIDPFKSSFKVFHYANSGNKSVLDLSFYTEAIELLQQLINEDKRIICFHESSKAAVAVAGRRFYSVFCGLPLELSYLFLKEVLIKQGELSVRKQVICDRLFKEQVTVSKTEQ